MKKETQTPQLPQNAVSGSRFVPMLFSTPMVQAILNGTKTETRIIIDVDTSLDFIGYIIGDTKKNGQIGFGKDVKIIKTIKPKVNIGDIIWVRETFQESLNPNEFCYKADTDNPIYLDKGWKWKPSLFMPKNACRLFLEVISVSFGRLQDVDEQSAINEGIENLSADELKYNLFRNYLRSGNEANYQDATTDNAIWSYQTLWQKINGKDNWDLNPYVWVYKFRSISVPPNFLKPVLVAGLSLEEWISKETAPRISSLWGQKYAEYSPYLCENIIGDGLQLVYLGTINNRPYHWLILIDSKTDVCSNDFDFEDILQPIEEECGRCIEDGCESCQENGEECEYPNNISWGGGHWGMIVNFGTGVVG